MWRKGRFVMRRRFLKSLISIVTLLTLILCLNGNLGCGTGSVSAEEAELPQDNEKPVINPLITGVNSYYVLYETEEIYVDSIKPIYYAVLKKNTDIAVKKAELVPAARGGIDMQSDYLYVIDISTLSASKENYVGITTTLEAGADGMVPVINIPVHANQKKIVFNINWAIEGSEACGRKVLQNVIVSNNDSTVVTYQHTGYTGDNTGNIRDLDIQWRKGSNGEWKDIDDLSAVRWESMKISGAVVYFRLAAKNQTSEVEGNRFSKENKIKCSITKAAAVNLDVSKVTLSIKNGMQFRLNGSTEKWYTVLPYSSASTNNTLIRNPGMSTQFDPFTEATTAKASGLLLSTIYETMGLNEPVSGEAITFDVRIAATAKKSASRISTITVPAQGSAPSATVTAEPGQYRITSLVATDKMVESPTFEYFIANKNDVSMNYLDISTIKWASINNGTALKGTLKCTYTRTDGVRKTVNIVDPGAVLLIRRRSIAASAKAKAVIASKYTVITLPAYIQPTPKP